MPRSPHKNKGKSWHRTLTHCPKGHPYSEENTWHDANGYRFCRSCAKERSSARTRANYYVAGYRDQRCPICGQGWFVNASTHVTKKHGLHVGGLSSADWRENQRILTDERDRFSRDPKVQRRRWQRWAAAVLDERTKGWGYLTRLSKRWRVTVPGASKRVRLLAQRGMVPPYGKQGHRRAR